MRPSGVEARSETVLATAEGFLREVDSSGSSQEACEHGGSSLRGVLVVRSHVGVLSE